MTSRSTVSSGVAMLLWLLLAPVINGDNLDAVRSARIVGKWQSDAKRTMDFNTRHARLDETQIAELSQIFGRNSLDFTRQTCTVYSPALTIDRGGDTIELDEETVTLSYQVIGTSPTAIAIVTKDEVLSQILSIWHFEDDYMWTYIGDSPIAGGRHLREYFRRVRNDEKQE